MSTVLLLGVVLTGIVVLTPVADRMRVPQPVLLMRSRRSGWRRS